jgi:hypothetical protein
VNDALSNNHKNYSVSNQARYFHFPFLFFYYLFLTFSFSHSFTHNRMKYCRQVIALALNIKNHFDRMVNHQQGKPIKQFSLPLEMPSHMQLTDSSSEVVSYQFDSVEDYLCEKYPADKSRNSSAVPALSCSRPKRSSSTRRPKRYEDEDDSSDEEGDDDEEEEEYGSDGDRPYHHQQRRSPRKLQAIPKIKTKTEFLPSSSPRSSMKTKKSYKAKPSSLSTSCHSQDAGVPLKRKRGRPPKNRSAETNKEEEMECEAMEWTIHSPMDDMNYNYNHHHNHLHDFENDFQPIVGEDSDEDDNDEEEGIAQIKKRRFNTPGKLVYHFLFFFILISFFSFHRK